VVTIRVDAGLEGGGGVAGTTVSVLAIGGAGAGAIRGATGGIDVDGAPDDGALDDGAADDGTADDRPAAGGADGDGPDAVGASGR
jgi:hypothetical protein